MVHSCLKRRSSGGGDGGLFVGVGHLKDTEVTVVSAYDLDAYGEAFRGEAGRDGDGWVACYRDEPAGAHPVNIVIELDSINRCWVGSLDVEGGELRCRQDEVIVFVEEGLEALPDLTVELFGFGDIRAGKSEAVFYFFEESVFVGGALGADALAVVGGGVPGAKGLEGEVGTGEVWFGFFDDAAERFEDFALSVDHS